MNGKLKIILDWLTDTVASDEPGKPMTKHDLLRLVMQIGILGMLIYRDCF